MILIDTNYGAIQVELDKKNAPVTCENFLSYIQEGFYDNTLFHRVIDNFMIQGGGFEPEFVQKTTRSPIKNEADLAQSNKRGTIAMARTSEPHSATAQFFINVADNVFLDHRDKTPAGWGYCVFGRVKEGMDIVDKIKAVSTASRAGHHDVPVEDVLIERISLLE